MRIGKQINTLCACLAALLPLVTFSSCSDGSHHNSAVISVQDQKILLLEEGQPLKAYPVSTSRFGLGSERGSHRTPLGNLEVARKEFGITN